MTCPLKHPAPPFKDGTVITKDDPCFFFFRTGCKRGKDCEFSHERKQWAASTQKLDQPKPGVVAAARKARIEKNRAEFERRLAELEEEEKGKVSGDIHQPVKRPATDMIPEESSSKGGPPPSKRISVPKTAEELAGLSRQQRLLLAKEIQREKEKEEEKVEEEEKKPVPGPPGPPGPPPDSLEDFEKYLESVFGSDVVQASRDLKDLDESAFVELDE